MSDREQPTAALKPRTVFPKPAQTPVDARAQPGVFVLKFWEGTHAAYEDGAFVFDPARVTSQDLKLLERAALDADLVASQLKSLNALLGGAGSVAVQRVFQRPDQVLEEERLEGERNTGEELADKTLYYYVAHQNASPEQTARLIDQINAFAVVELAYPHLVPQPARADIPPMTTDFSGSQGNLNPAPVGIDARHAWGFFGGRGEGVRVIDVE